MVRNKELEVSFTELLEPQVDRTPGCTDSGADGETIARESDAWMLNLQKEKCAECRL
jgi:hypothetical protein